MTTGTLFLILYITQYFYSNFAGVYLSNGLFFFERCSLITATVCAYKLNNAR